MSGPTVAVVANDVKHLTEKVEKLEARVQTMSDRMIWVSGAIAGGGVFVGLLGAKFLDVIGLS